MKLLLFFFVFSCFATKSILVSAVETGVEGGNKPDNAAQDPFGHGLWETCDGFECPEGSACVARPNQGVVCVERGSGALGLGVEHTSCETYECPEGKYCIARPNGGRCIWIEEPSSSSNGGGVDPNGVDHVTDETCDTFEECPADSYCINRPHGVRCMPYSNAMR